MNSSVDQSLRESLQNTSLKDEDIDPKSDDRLTNVCSTTTPHPMSLPKRRVRTVRVDGVVTDITLQVFAERIVITCSQKSGRIGHWLLCKATALDSLAVKKYEWDVTHLLGAARDDPLWSVYAKHVTDRIVQQHAAIQEASNAGSGGSSSITEAIPSAVLLGLTLDAAKCKDPAFFHTIVDLLASTYIDVISTSM